MVLLRADARCLPLLDASVDLIVTSPPYFGLRSYQDGGRHYERQIGSEATPAEFVDALIACTREMVRVLKPAGSIWVNLGDKYAGGGGGNYGTDRKRGAAKDGAAHPTNIYNRPAWLEAAGTQAKSLMGVPWRYALRCMDELGLILRQEVVWDKPNALPESAVDRCRRSHEQWFHFTLSPHYFSAVDEIREPHLQPDRKRADVFGGRSANTGVRHNGAGVYTGPTNGLGKLPGSVWGIPTQPLIVPEHVAHARCCGGRAQEGCEDGLDHYAAFPMEWPRRIIRGWAPREVCTACGQGRRPVVVKDRQTFYGAGRWRSGAQQVADGAAVTGWAMDEKWTTTATITGYSCDCPDTSAPATPGVVLDPCGGTGTTALVADVLGYHGISADLSGDYGRIAAWRTTDPGERARAAQAPPPKVVRVAEAQDALFDLGGAS